MNNMKRKLLYLLVGVFLVTSLSGCTLWEDKWEEVIPLPEIETPVEPDPWEPGGEEHEV